MIPLCMYIYNQTSGTLSGRPFEKQAQPIIQAIKYAGHLF